MMIWLRRILLVLLIVSALLCGAFFSVGGMQMVRLMRGPALPPTPTDATPASDVVFLQEAVLRNERGATSEQLARFRRAIDAAPPAASPDDFTIIASEALAQLDNAHSTLSEQVMRRLPIRLHWLADGLIVVKGRPEQVGLLGRKVVEIGGRSPDELAGQATKLVGGGTPGWVRYRSEYFLTAPAALRALGASTSGDTVVLQTIDRSGSSETTEIRADPEITHCATFWAWTDALPGDTHFRTGGWVTLLKPDSSLPLYQQEPARLFLVRDLPEHDAVYLRMSGSVNDDDETAAKFTERASDTLRKTGRRNAIVDFRYNWGGSFNLSLPFTTAIVRAIPPDGRIYLITGPNTFSAGLIAASQFKRYAAGRLSVVGGDVGDHLRFRAEGMLVTMPATGAEAYVTSAWDDVADDCGWFSDCWPPNKFFLKGVGTLTPDLRVANTWESYASGRDRIVEAVFGDIAQRRSSRR
jgi:hypothetical protein